jgi:hypothetical protein
MLFVIMFDRHILPNGRCCVPPGPAHPDPDFPPGGEGRPLPPDPGWSDDEGYLAALGEEDEPDEPDLYQDPDNAPPAGLDDAELAALIAEAREVGEDQGYARWWLGRRGPGMPGSARTFPGEYAGPTAGFAAGRELDTTPGCAGLALFAEDAAGPDDRYLGASDDELVGVICAWDRVEASAAARKHAAVAELIRRRPDPDGAPAAGAGQMPQTWEEFTPAELAPALGESRAAAEAVLDLANDLAVKLPGTRAAFLSGIVTLRKTLIIARSVEALDPAEARAAEALVLDRAGRLTPGGLRAAIGRAVMEVAPGKAHKRREQAARLARVERWAEDSGNGALAGRELPPAAMLAADQRVTAWAKQLKAAGLDGDMDQLRAQALLDLLLGTDSRPRRDDTDSSGPDGRAGGWPGAGPLDGAIPPGFAGKANLTIPLTTLTDLADRPGELGGIGPIDPDLARDLAAAAARNPRTAWCVTVTDADGHAIGHGCARPEPKNARTDRAKRLKPGATGGNDPPARSGDRDGPRFSFIALGRDGPPGGHGTWRLSTGEPGRPDLIIAIGPIATGSCDHRHEARGHDPGVLLRHLTEIRHASCTAPGCRRPAAQCDFEHNIPFEAGGRSCECNGGPKCRYDHRLKQHPRWKVEQPAPAVMVWTTPAGRQYATEPTRYPI